MPDLKLRKVLRELVEKQGSISQLANETGISSSQLYRFFRGDRGISWTTLERICEHCDVTFANREAE